MPNIAEKSDSQVELKRLELNFKVLVNHHMAAVHYKAIVTPTYFALGIAAHCTKTGPVQERFNPPFKFVLAQRRDANDASAEKIGVARQRSPLHFIQTEKDRNILCPTNARDAEPL